jgi:beta-lactamase regulating signal transducer with metallopeptidase domain
VTQWIAQTLAMSSLLMLLVLVSRRAVAGWFGARVAYALWLIPLARMILPPVPGRHPLFEAMTGLPQIAALPLTAAATPAPLMLDLPPDVASAFDAPPAPAGTDWVSLLLGVWLAGAALFFGWQMLRYRLFVVRAMRGATHLSTSAGVQVFASDSVEGPIASGVLRRRIFLPRDFLTRYTSSERRQALLHEGAHHDRKDLLANVVAIGIVALHWWNPLAHIAYRCFRADQELACDATVLADAEPDQLYAYGSALVKSTVGRAPAAACAFNRTDEIKRRLTMIKRGRLGFGRRSAGVALAVAATVTGLAVTASGSRAAVRIEPAIPAFAPAVEPTLPVPAPAGGTSAPVHIRQGHRVALTAPPAPAAPPAPFAAPAPPPPPQVTQIHHHSDGSVTVERRVETQTEARDRARADAQAIRDTAQARRDSVRAERDRTWAERDRQQADRDRAQADRDRAQADRDRELAARDPVRMSNVRVMVSQSLDQARAEMVSTCAARGTPVSADERDWGKLALCDKAAFNAQVIRSMEEARTQIVRDRGMDEDGRAKALGALNGAIARMKARGIS